MCPVIFRWGYLNIYSWQLMYIVAILASIYISVRIDIKLELEIGKTRITYLYIYSAFVALIGAKVLEWLVLWTTQAKAGDIGKAYYGGVFVIIVLVTLISRYWRCSAYKLLDLIAIATTLGGAIGRIGCLLHGCCRGEPVKWCWIAIKYPIIYKEETFPTLLDLHFGIRWKEYLSAFEKGGYVHPAPIYYSIGFLLIFIFLYSQRKKINEIPGNLFYIGLILHGVLRFLLEIIRDNPPYLYWKLNISGLLSIVSILVGILAIFLRRFSPIANFNSH